VAPSPAFEPCRLPEDSIRRAFFPSDAADHMVGAQRVTLTLRLTGPGRALLTRVARLKLSFRATFTPAGGTPVTGAGSFTLR
jgi:hypothetical protein